MMTRSLLTFYGEYTEKGQQIYIFQKAQNRPNQKNSEQMFMHNFYKKCAIFGKHATVIESKD